MKMGPESQENKRPRAALYIDGFNLYHPIKRFGEDYNYLKWLSLWGLGLQLTERAGQELVKVVFCTAVPSVRQNAEQRDRHVRYNDAQRACGVTVVSGHYVPENVEQDGIATGEVKWTEKQTDINVALELLFDGLDDVYDVALLLSADTDQVATARAFHQRLEPLGKTLVGVAPPDRKAPQGYSQFGIKSVTLQKFELERCVMPESLMHDGRRIDRPVEYSPPEGWVHPKDRPKRKVPKPPKRTAWKTVAKG
jgi:uncharacterized LabA/DUF88 family protein